MRSLRLLWIVVACGSPTTTSDAGDTDATTDAASDEIAAPTDAPADSSVDRCNRPKKCPNDSPPSPLQISSCQKGYDDCLKDPSCAKCIDLSNAYTDCAYEHIVCGTDGKTDLAATSTAVSAACSAQFDAQKACFAG